VTPRSPDSRSASDRAALAFSVLPSSAAEVVNRHLTIGERIRLREGLARNRDAPDSERYAAMKTLAAAVRSGGMIWPRPSLHDDADCPFNIVIKHPPSRVVDVLERVAAREPLEVAVALCHLPEATRTEIWKAMTPAAHEAIANVLDEVHWVSRVSTRAYAKDIATRISRELRRSAQ
jgi:hypothetical protein